MALLALWADTKRLWKKRRGALSYNRCLKPQVVKNALCPALNIDNIIFTNKENIIQFCYHYIGLKKDHK